VAFITHKYFNATRIQPNEFQKLRWEERRFEWRNIKRGLKIKISLAIFCNYRKKRKWKGEMAVILNWVLDRC
jgi:hypothetical protein